MLDPMKPRKIGGRATRVVLLSVFAVMALVLAYGVSKSLSTRTNGKPEIAAGNSERKASEGAERFAAPRAQSDDGTRDVADLHAREDLLLENYSRIEHSDGKFRIPIERAMEVLAQRGLPVAAPAVRPEGTMSGDEKPAVTVPLTNGFARTDY